jgi:ABC-2 type transport system ATP-binding protein
VSVTSTLTATLTVVDVVKRYGARRALAGVTLEVGPGEVLGLLGPNGAGKSTLVSIVGALLVPDAGAVWVDGVDVVARPATARARIGLAPQDTGLYEVLTVREHLVFFADLVGLRRRARAARVDELASAFRLEGLMDRPAFQLSGGERRRLHTAIAFVARPRLLLLDEPTVGADIETRGALLEVVRHAADDGAAVVYSTHYLPEIEMLRASIAILDGGRVIARGALDALVAAHGRAAVELSFDGPPPCDLGAARAIAGGSVVRVDASDPATAVPAILARLGPAVERLRGVELLRPSLDSVFVSLTGRRYDEEEGHVAVA